MDGFKEFQGKDLDAAIQDACLYYNAKRERLEIEILQDAKSGIFGIVGARKAKIRARRAHLRDTVQSMLGEISGHDKPHPASGGESAERGTPGQRLSRRANTQQPPRFRRQPAAARQGEAEEKPERADRVERTDRGRTSQARDDQSRRRKPAPASTDREVENEESQGYPPMEESDAPAVQEAARQVVALLLSPLVDTEPVIEAVVADGAVAISISGLDENASILIGRDGSTLAAVQYLASRLISRRLEISVRVSLDVGNYRQRLENELKEMAQSLAERVVQTGKSLSTRPLSSYQRRIVHLFLKGQEDIQTRSTGEGGLKRVLIMRRKSARRQAQAEKPADKARDMSVETFVETTAAKSAETPVATSVDMSADRPAENQ